MVKQRNLSVVIAVIFVLNSFFHIAAIRKQDDPIGKTQTNPILYKDKQEELKDGEKGAPMPSIQFYQNSGFLVAPPVKEPTKPEPKETVPEYGSDIPEDLDETQSDPETDWWLGGWGEEGTEDDR